jgi:hypothetical protein
MNSGLKEKLFCLACNRAHQQWFGGVVFRTAPDRQAAQQGYAAAVQHAHDYYFGKRKKALNGTVVAAPKER